MEKNFTPCAFTQNAQIVVENSDIGEKREKNFRPPDPTSKSALGCRPIHLSPVTCHSKGGGGVARGGGTTMVITAACSQVEKIKTMGDCYMCACFAPEGAAEDQNRDTARSVLRLCSSMHAIVREHTLGGAKLKLRAGMDCGPVVAGIIGKIKFCFDMWGVCPALSGAVVAEMRGGLRPVGCGDGGVRAPTPRDPPPSVDPQ